MPKITLATGAVLVFFTAFLTGPAATASVAKPAAPATVPGLSDCKNLNDLCLWNGTNFGGSDSDFLFRSDGSLPGGISNNEKSGANELNGSSQYARLYWGSNFTGAWVCLNPGTSFSDFSNFTFNNGSGQPGFGQSIKNNIASVGLNSSACSNPL
jgi:hypothetical protein